MPNIGFVWLVGGSGDMRDNILGDAHVKIAGLVIFQIIIAAKPAKHRHLGLFWRKAGSAIHPRMHQIGLFALYDGVDFGLLNPFQHRVKAQKMMLKIAIIHQFQKGWMRAANHNLFNASGGKCADRVNGTGFGAALFCPSNDVKNFHGLRHSLLLA